MGSSFRLEPVRTAMVGQSGSKRRDEVRFMMLMIPSEKAEQGVLPDPEFFAAMMRYNEDLQKAGVLLGLDGLHPSAKGARVRFRGGQALVTDGPFTESKEVMGGYWMIQVGSKAEAVDWARRCPAADGDTIEVRQVQEMSEFPDEIVEATKDSAAVLQQHLGQHNRA
jgi:hypothetical protein